VPTINFRPRPPRLRHETGACDPNISYGYCAQVAEVEVDLDTGHVTVKRLSAPTMWAKAVNPQQVEGQIEGCVAQVSGWTLLEEYIQRDGRAVTQHLSTYLIPGVLDVPSVVEPIILEFPDPQGPLGARGMAEMPFIPTAPAIGAAIHNATGVWLDQLPYTPERVWQAGLPFQLRADGSAINPAWAEYALVSGGAGNLSVELRRVPVDVTRIVADARASGMPHVAWWVQDWQQQS
jgi:hypothetical protein